MNKETGELFKNLIDMFVSREQMLKELLEDKEKVIYDLQATLDKIYN